MLSIWLTSQFYWLVELTLYHIMPNFNDPEKEAFRKHCGKRKKCWLPAFSPLPRMFSTLSHTKPYTPQILILTHQQQTAFENIVGKREIARFSQNVCYSIR